jgi:TolA-binding protein
LLAEFLRQAPGHPKRSYAIFAAGVCLANLGLEKRALSLLRSLPVSYPDRGAELKDVRVVLAKRREATVYAEEIQSLLGGG